MTVVITSYTIACLPVWEIIHSLKLVDYLLIRQTNHGITIPDGGNKGRVATT